MTTIRLGRVPLALDDYAIQGNAILGVKESGKTYSATYLAEQLLEAGIPWVAFDPIDVWRWLRVPGRGRGYPVVIAGDNGDLPLTPESAPRIVRAAMIAGVPLVLNLYSAALTKSDWRKIVTECLRVLLFENKDHGLRHVFLEEAPEFAPQRVRPDQGAVYDMIERLARMGGNAQLGYTLIGQRAEEVNKAILEICDGLFLHRQKGRNSLTALSKWLDVAGATNRAEVIRSIPLLGAGECWVWARAESAPRKTTMPVKQSMHPDRRQSRGAAPRGQSVDVAQFVTEMQAVLDGKPVVQPLSIAPAREPAPVVEEEAMNDKQYQEFQGTQKRIVALLEKLAERSLAAPAVPPPQSATHGGHPDVAPADEEALYQRIVERLKREAPQMIRLLARSTEIHVVHEQTVVEVDTSTLRGKLLLMVADGYFDSWTSGVAATNELARRGWRNAQPNVYRALDGLVGEGVVQKEARQGYKRVEGIKIVRQDR